MTLFILLNKKNIGALLFVLLVSVVVFDVVCF